MKKLVIGCGYLGLRVAQRWTAQGDQVFALTRSPERAQTLARLGVQPIVGDVTQPSSLLQLPAVDTVLYSVGYDRRAAASINEVYVEGMRNVLNHLPNEIGRLLYTSSTGVYGQNEGEWVDEDSTCQPQREGGIACLEAENLVRASAKIEQLNILRLAGLYGPGRIPSRAQMDRGEPIATAAQGWLNLIHVIDAVRAIVAVENSPLTRSLLLVADSEPVTRQAYFEYMAQLCDAPRPSFTAPEPNSAVSQRGVSSKRVNSQRMFEILRQPLRFPTYRSGLKAILSLEE